MEKMLVVVVDTEAKAYEAERALKQLDEEGNITVYSEAVIEKSAKGTISQKHHEYEFPVRSVAGTAIGAFIGVLGAGPLGLVGGAAIGAVTGGLAGSLGDFYRAEVGAEFFDEVYTALKPGKYAVVADIDEEWITPLDTQMEALGATVIRTAKQSFEAEQRAKDVAELRTEIDSLKAELAHAHADRKAKLQRQIDKLEARLETQQDQIRKRLDEIKSETDAKVRGLHEKGRKARADMKARLDAQTKRVEHNYKTTDTKLRHALAKQLRGAAARVEKEQPEPVSR
jgi:uncharacterized membrane protein